MTISFDHTTLHQRVLFGDGNAVAGVSTGIDGLDASRVLLIAGASSVELADAIESATPVVARISEVVQHVPAENAARAVDEAVRSESDVVVAVGGGSAIGLAKIVARDIGLPIVAVPTTFAGSEATNVWGITEANKKTTGSDPRVLPRVIIYDASLTATLPARLAVASGLNAMAHAVDGLWAPKVDPINVMTGSEALRTLVPGLRALARDGSDRRAREQTLFGSYLAAVAFASAGSGMHHKICHALGGTYGLPHAQTHSVVIAYVAAFNAQGAPEAAERIAGALGEPTAGGGLFRLRRELGVEGSLCELGFDEADIPAAAALILPSIPASNPRIVSQEDLEHLLRAAWAGDPLD